MNYFRDVSALHDVLGMLSEKVPPEATGLWLFHSSSDNDKMIRIVAIMCAAVPRFRRFLQARQSDGNLVHTFARGVHFAGVSRF